MNKPRDFLIYKDGHEWDGYEKWGVSTDIKNEWVLSKNPIHVSEVIPGRSDSERLEWWLKETRYMCIHNELFYIRDKNNNTIDKSYKTYREAIDGAIEIEK